MASILIVEDDFFIREMAEVMIQGWGHQTLGAGNVAQALSIVHSHPEVIDILFTDIYLRGAVHGGCEIAREAAKVRPTLRVLYTTGNALTLTLRGLFVEGASCLLKPYNMDQLYDYLDGLGAAHVERMSSRYG